MHIQLFSQAHVEDPPFYNDSGSYYLSWLMKGDEGISGKSKYYSLKSQNVNSHDATKLATPSRALGHSWIVPNTDVLNDGGAALGSSTSTNHYTPIGTLTGSEWRRVIVQASQSYWRPTKNTAMNASGERTVGDINVMSDFGSTGYGLDQNLGGGGYEILSGSNVLSASLSGSQYTGSSYGIKDSSGLYGDLLNPKIVFIGPST